MQQNDGDVNKLAGQVAAHAAVEAADIAWLCAMSMAERARMLEAACRAAAIMLRARASAAFGLG